VPTRSHRAWFLDDPAPWHVWEIPETGRVGAARSDQPWCSFCFLCRRFKQKGTAYCLPFLEDTGREL